MKIRMLSLMALTVVLLGLNAKSVQANDAAGPKAVVAKMAKAITEYDLKAAQSCIEPTKEGNQVFMESMKDMIGVAKKSDQLAITLTKKFGDQAQMITGAFPNSKMLAGEFDADKMTFKTAKDGKTAQAIKAGDEDDPLILVKTAKGWKMDPMASLTEDEILEFVISMAVLNMGLGEMTTAAEKAESFEDFAMEVQEIGLRMQEAMKAAKEASEE